MSETMNVMPVDRMPADNIMEQRDQLIDAMMPHVPFDGWSRVALHMAADDLNLSKKEADRLFPGSNVDFVIYAHEMMDRKMKEELARLDLPSMKIRERIATGVRVRLSLCEPQKDAIRKAMSLMALPQNSLHAMKAVYGTVDAIWYAAGDNATDWNFYSKRSLLAGVYSSTLLYWLNDISQDHQASWAFLDRRIENVMQIPKLKSQISKMANRLVGLPSLRKRALHKFKAKNSF